MWLHKSRSVSKRKRRCTISFLTLFCYVQKGDKGNVYLPNEETEINIKELLENTRIDCDNEFNYKLSRLDFNIFKLPLIDIKDNTSIYIGKQDFKIEQDIICIKKDNRIEQYLLLPYFKVDKDNLTEGKYINAHTKMFYHLGLFEMQTSIQKEDDDSITKLKNLKLIDSISLKNELIFDEFLNDVDNFKFQQRSYDYLCNHFLDYDGGLCYHRLPLTETIYYFDLSHLENPKIGNIKLEKQYFKNVRGGSLYFNRGRWFLQFRVGYNDYFIKDNCNGKYEKIQGLKDNNFYLNKHILLYNNQNNPYFPYSTTYVGELKKGNTDLRLKDLTEDLPFDESKDGFIKFQFSPFNNLNLVYFYKYQYGYDLYEYSIIPEIKSLINIYELNPKTINSKYKIKINKNYKNYYHCYLYYLDDDKKVPYIQIWKDNNTNQVYGCILNMKGKWGVFDKEIIIEKENKRKIK